MNRKAVTLLNAMKKQTALRVLTALVILVGSIPRMQASLMEYSFSGTQSGSFGGTPFNDATVTINLFADTANVVELDYGYGLTFTVSGSSTVSVNGIGTGTFTTPKRVFTTTIYGSPQFSSVGFSESNANNSGYDIWDFDSSVFYNYDLKSVFGPIGGLNQQNGTAFSEPTTLGQLTFNSPGMYPATFSALQVVPEPNGLLILGCGTVILCRRRKN